MHARSKLALMTLVTTTQTVGCYTTWDIAPKALVRLDGFREGQTVQIRPMDPDSFTSDTELHFRGKDQVDLSAKFSRIDVQSGILLGDVRGTGAPVQVDLTRIASVEARNFSIGGTIAMVAGSVLLVLPIAAFTGIAIGLEGHGFASGRPLRVHRHTSPVRAPFVLQYGQTTRQRDTRNRDHGTRARLLAHWAEEASAECASIPAFLALARDLEMASAPSSLVNAALRAAREEAVHTDLCLALANDHSATRIATMTPPTPSPIDTNLEMLLERLALEAFWDGCVAEGAAATIARRAATHATDDATHAALGIIARDEASHAKLAQRVLAFCLSTGGRSVRNALGESLERKHAAQEASLEMDGGYFANESGVDEEFTLEHGLVSNDIARDARIETWEKSVAMLSACT